MKHRDQIMKEHSEHAQAFGAFGDITYGEWHEVLVRYGSVCLVCGVTDRLTPDHVIPLARGGENVIANIQPLCLDCNRRKNAKTADYRDGRVISEDVSVPEYFEDAYRTVKIRSSSYRLLKILAAQNGEGLAEMVNRLVDRELKREDQLVANVATSVADQPSQSPPPHQDAANDV